MSCGLLGSKKVSAILWIFFSWISGILILKIVMKENADGIQKAEVPSTKEPARFSGAGGIFFALLKYTFVLTNNNYFETDS